MDDGFSGGECAVFCCLACCEGCVEGCCESDHLSCRCACVLLVLATLALVAVLVLAYAFVVPVRVTVEDASLGRLELLPSPAPGANGTSSSLAYDVSLAVALRNPNWAMTAWRTGPLDLELRFRGTPFARARLPAATGWDRIRAESKEVYRATTAAVGSAFGTSDGGAAEELARESAAGVFELELLVYGEVNYEMHPHRRSFRATCPLQLALSTAIAPAAFARVKCTY